MMRVTLLGAGNGAHALAGDLSLRGHEVRLWENPAFEKNLEPLMRNHFKHTLRGKVEGEAQLSLATTDPKEAISGAEIIYCVMPSYGQEATFDLVVPFLEEKQKVVLMPGNFGSLSLYSRLKKRGMTGKIWLGETDTLPYATRLLPDKSSLVYGLKEGLWISAMPGHKTKELIREISGAFPIALNPLPDVIAVALSNTNMIIHPPIMMMNAARIERGERFRFYNDGVTPSVCRVMEKMDAERIAVGKAWGYDLISEYEDAISNYNLNRNQFRSLFEVFTRHPVYGNHGADSPDSMSYRYLTEDVPFLLQPLSEMGKIADVVTPTIDSIIQLAGVIEQKDYKAHGRGMKALGVGDLTVEEIKNIVKYGYTTEPTP